MKKIFKIPLIIALFFLVSCSLGNKSTKKTKLSIVELEKKYDKALFAGGCFWCSESDFEKLDGVIEVVSGYAGGDEVNPSYEEVSSGNTGHRESVMIYFDPSFISYDELLNAFWMHIDPTDAGGSFVDRGFQYSSAIFYFDEAQKLKAEESKKHIDLRGKFQELVVTEILPYSSFYPAEDYHQDYYEKNSIKYKYYRSGSGRDDFIEENWKSKGDVLDGLTPLQFHVTQNNGTEKPFDNEYWDNEEDGIYVDVVSGEPLFSSNDKYISGTGWPSFIRPLVEDNVLEVYDNTFFRKRIDIRGAESNSHLGHVFNDGPKNSTGLRYCMNSAALRFVPKENLVEMGYEEFVKDFE